jgi:site-specific DNA-methyltransferase (adenine-specific)
MKPYYDQDGIVLYHADCRDAVQWLEADVLLTDPPYGIKWPSGQLHNDRAIRDAATMSIIGDEDSSVRDDVLEMWGKQKQAVIFGSWRITRPERVAHRLIWNKEGRHPGVSPCAVFPNDEEIYLIGDGWVGPPMPTVLTTREQRSLQPELIGHPTPKPINLIHKLISKCYGGAIADPFAGSGSILVAAKQCRRPAIGVEIEERYCEIAATRLSQSILPFAEAKPARTPVWMACPGCDRTWHQASRLESDPTAEALAAQVECSECGALPPMKVVAGSSLVPKADDQPTFF